ncbi:MAG: flagellar hook-length control protein FliK [Dongiaceae bacterium]
MDMIPLDGFPAGTAPVPPAGNASSADGGNGVFGMMLAEASGGDESKGDADGGKPDAAAAALLALLFPQNPALQQQAAEAAPEGETTPDPDGVAPVVAPAETPGKQPGVVEGEAGAAEPGEALLANRKQDRNEAPNADTGLAKSVTATAGPSAPPPAPAIPPELLGAEENAPLIKQTASKVNDVAPPPVAKTPEPAVAEAPKPAAAKPAEPAKPTAPETTVAHAAAADTKDDALPSHAHETDMTAPQSPAAGLVDRPATTAPTAPPQAAVERLAALLARPDLLAAHLQRAHVAGRDRISIELLPAELGRIEISLDFDRSGKLSAMIAADKPHTLDLLQRDQRGLERALQDAGFKTDSGSLSFNLRGDQRQHQNQPMPWLAAQTHSQGWHDAGQRNAGAMPAFVRPIADGRLDIEV